MCLDGTLSSPISGRPRRLPLSRRLLVHHLYSWYGSKRLTVFCRPPVKIEQNQKTKKPNNMPRTVKSLIRCHQAPECRSAEVPKRAALQHAGAERWLQSGLTFVRRKNSLNCSSRHCQYSTKQSGQIQDLQSFAGDAVVLSASCQVYWEMTCCVFCWHPLE